MDRQRRIEDNEKLFREVNERVATVHEGVDGPDPEWVCECGDETCFEKVRVSLRDYHRIRDRGDRFLLKPGHEKPDIERIVEQFDDCIVVEKHALPA